MKNQNQKISSLAILTALGTSFTSNANEFKNFIPLESNFEETNNINYNNLLNERPTANSVSEVYNKIIDKSERERIVIADAIQKDFGGFCSKNFFLTKDEQECVNTSWKKDEDALKFLKEIAFCVKNKIKLNECIINGEKKSFLDVKSIYLSGLIRGSKKEVSYTSPTSSAPYGTVSIKISW